jgi:hypothetical protein
MVTVNFPTTHLLYCSLFLVQPTGQMLNFWVEDFPDFARFKRIEYNANRLA